MAWLQLIIVFHGRHYVRHLGICNSICVKLLQVMTGVIPSNLKEKRRLSQTVFLKSTNAAHTHTHAHAHTHTHDDSIRRNAMHYILPKNYGTINFGNKIQRYYVTLKKFIII